MKVNFYPLRASQNSRLTLATFTGTLHTMGFFRHTFCFLLALTLIAGTTHHLNCNLTSSNCQTCHTEVDQPHQHDECNLCQVSAAISKGFQTSAQLVLAEPIDLQWVIAFFLVPPPQPELQPMRPDPGLANVAKIRLQRALTRGLPIRGPSILA